MFGPCDLCGEATHSTTCDECRQAMKPKRVGGLVRFAQQAQPTSAIVWAEAEQDGESYIPGPTAKRKRAQ